MARESVGTVVRRRVLGLLYLVLVAALITLSIAFYNKVFTKTIDVTLKADHTGNQLITDSDVKVRGLIVGRVSAINVDSGSHACTEHTLTCVSVTLALDPGKVGLIPKNVSAQILPKTLFGEQYVSLVLPRSPESHIASGDVIPQDRSQGALETEKVLGDLLPLLQAVQPAELNATLTAMAQALQGRGEQLGQTLVTLDKYLKAANPYTKPLVDDLKKLGQVALTYNQAAPDLRDTLDNLLTSARTVISKRVQLDTLLNSVTNTSGVLQSFLSDNEQRLIRITGQTNKIYQVLDTYAPEYTCLLAGLVNLNKLTSSAVVNHQIQLGAVLDTTNIGPYKDGEQPRLVTGYGPHCFGLPDNIQPVNSKGYFQIPPEFQCLNDGAALTDNPCGQHPAQSGDQRALGSPAENTLVSVLIAKSYGTTPDQVPPIATALAAPLFRGQTVVVK
jgi:virulence factor Mce-like protein